MTKMVNQTENFNPAGGSKENLQGVTPIKGRYNDYTGPWYETLDEAISLKMWEVVKTAALFLTPHANYDIPEIAKELFIFDENKKKFRISPYYWTGDKELDSISFQKLIKENTRSEWHAMIWFLVKGAEEYGKEKFAELCEEFNISPEMVQELKELIIQKLEGLG